MSFVTAVKDYVDWINASFDSFQHTFGTELTLAALTKSSFLYLWQSIKIAFIYIFTFQWLRDLVYLPTLTPAWNPFDLFGRTLAFVPGEPHFQQNNYAVGFFNSFFACMPLTFAHLISARQFYVKGWQAAAATNGGIIAGHIFLLAAVLFGWRPLLIPWLQFEPGTFMIALVITYYTVKSTFGRTAFREITTPMDFAKIAGVGFLLTLCDQGVFFKYISTLTVGLEPTYIEPLTGTATSVTLEHAIYILGFSHGSVVFTAFFFWTADFLRKRISQAMNITYNVFVAHVNTLSRFGFTILLFMSLTFHGVDFLCANPLGYVPYDRALVPGDAAPYTTEDLYLKMFGMPTKKAEAPDPTKSDVEVRKEQAGQSKLKSKLQKVYAFPLLDDADLASFDRGVYFREAIATVKHETRAIENYRIPTSDFWASRKIRRKAPRAKFAKMLQTDMTKSDRTFHKKLQKTFGFRMGSLPEEGAVERQDREARLRARKLALARRLWFFMNNGASQKFDQFTIYRNVNGINGLIEPYTRGFSKTQLNILAELDDLLNTPRGIYAEQADRIEDLIDAYTDTFLNVSTDAPYTSRFELVEEMTAKLFEGQTEAQLKAKHKLAIWPKLFSFVQQKNIRKAVSQRVLRERLRANPYVTTLFRNDIDSFLARQPKEHMLSAREEAELYFKRVMLKSYIQTKRRIRHRRLLRANPAIGEAYPLLQRTTLSGNVYNHQFNGTYKVVRQLMHVDLDLMTNPTAARVMKFDMPLFKGGKEPITSLHEDLFTMNPRTVKRLRTPGRYRSTRGEIWGGNYYAGWDEQRRAVVLTNRIASPGPNKIVLNPKYPEFASLRAFDMETKPKVTSAKGKKTIKRIAVTTWPISSRMAADPLLYHDRPRALMADMPTRRDLRLPKGPELTRQEVRKQRRKVRDERALIRYFNPDFDFRPLQILFEEADRPHVSRKQARITAKLRASELPLPPDVAEDTFSLDRWPAGFILNRKAANVWWLEEKPPVPFVDRGGYVWPGHAELKINMKRYLPAWKAPTFTMKNPFVKAPKAPQ